jgi:hypothetical protein
MPNKTNKINPLNIAMKQVNNAAERLKLDVGFGENNEQQEQSQLYIYSN